jgi:excisionase family DNA binding protein
VLLSSLEEAKRLPRVIAPDDIVFPERRGFARLSPEKCQEIARAGSQAARRVTWQTFNQTTARAAARKRWQRKGSRVHASAKALARGGFLTFLSAPFETPQVYMRVTDARERMGVSNDTLYQWIKEKKLRRKTLRGRVFIDVESMMAHRSRMTRRLKRFV